MTYLLILICFFNYKNGLHDTKLFCSYNAIYHAHRWWTVFSSVFVHGNLMHLLSNMLFLFFFGKELEKIVGSFQFLLIFIIGGAFGMFICAEYYPHNMPCVGASGAICCVLAMLMLFNPWKLSFLLMFFPMPLGLAGVLYLLTNLEGFYAAGSHHHHGGLSTAYAAHLAGLFMGIVFGIYLCPNWKKNILAIFIQTIGFVLIIFAFYYWLYPIR